MFVPDFLSCPRVYAPPLKEGVLGKNSPQNPQVQTLWRVVVACASLFARKQYEEQEGAELCDQCAVQLALEEWPWKGSDAPSFARLLVKNRVVTLIKPHNASQSGKAWAQY
jgi:hypothetical protein